MKATTLFLIAAVAALTLAGCGGTEPLPPDESGFVSTAGDGNSAFTTGSDSSAGADFLPFEGALEGDRELIQNLVIYFEFDSSEIRSEFNPMLAAHGRYLASDSRISLRLEGHADERGSREYNIGLGERRAQAVRQILLLQGATAAQIATVSYGEEQPAVFGSDEESYSLNRRVGLIYR